MLISFAVLIEDANNEKAFHAKVVSLIRLQSIDDALEIIEKLDESLRRQLSYEHAYCLYRKNCPKETMEILKASGEVSPAVKELMAQSVCQTNMMLYMFIIIFFVLVVSAGRIPRVLHDLFRRYQELNG